MSVVDPTPAEMKQRPARCSELKPCTDTLNEAHGIPPEVGQEIARHFGHKTLDTMAALGVRFGN